MRRPQRLVAPIRRPVRAAAVATGVATVAALAARPRRQLGFRTAMQGRHDAFYTTIAVAGAAAPSYSSWEDEVADLFEQIGRLQEAAMLAPVGEDLDEINALVGRLPHDLTQIRQRGYVHQAQLEQHVSDLVARWDRLYDQIADMLFQQQTELVESSNRLLDLVDRLYEPGASRATVESCWAGVAALRSRIESAHRSLTGMYDDVGQELEKIDGEIDRIEWILEQVESAKFSLLQGEAPVRAATARWIRQGEDQGPLGILYLTDQRLLFERKEELATAKFLFITLKKEVIHEFQFDAPVGSIEAVSVSEQRSGILGATAQVIELRFDHTAAISSALFQLQKDDARTWEMLLGRVKSGEIDRARTAEAAAEAVSMDQARRELPTNCPNCSAPLDQTLLRGMTHITCAYCGSVIQI